jgi:hypothetical protein
MLTDQQIKDGFREMIIRGKAKKLTPFDYRYSKGQTLDHSVFSLSGHDWETGEQTRTFRKCFLQMCCPPNWVPIPSPTFSTEDIQWLIANNG